MLTRTKVVHWNVKNILFSYTRLRMLSSIVFKEISLNKPHILNVKKGLFPGL